MQAGGTGSTAVAATTSPTVVPALASNLLYQYSQNDEPFSRLTHLSLKVVTWNDLAPFMGLNRHTFLPNATVYAVLQTGQANPTKGGRPQQYWQLQVFNPKNGNTATFSRFYLRASSDGGNPRYVWGRPSQQPSYWSFLPGPEYVLNLKTDTVEQAKNQLPPARGSLI